MTSASCDRLLKVELSHQQLNITELKRSLDPTQIDHLCLPCCEIESLDGLEDFTNLLVLNLRNNKLSSADQLLKLSCQDTLEELDLTGNDIEYFFEARFQQLQKRFPRLIILNGRDYQCQKVKLKNKKTFKVGSFMKELKKVQKQLRNTLKKQKAHYYSSSTARDCESNYATAKKGQQYKASVKNSPSYGVSPHNRLADTNQTASDLSQIRMPLDDVSFDKQNRSNNISMLSLDNVPMTRSVSKSKMKGGLQIKTLDMSPQEMPKSHIPLTQPTATFATQRQRQSQAGFMFRKQQKQDMYLDCSLSQDYVVTRRSSLQVGLASDDDDEILNQPRQHILNEKDIIADAHYCKDLMSRSLVGLRAWCIMRSEMPKKQGPF